MALSYRRTAWCVVALSLVAVGFAYTSDGGQTWADVTPTGARPMLATPDASEMLDAVDGERAYFVVTASTSLVLFATDDAGRTSGDRRRRDGKEPGAGLPDHGSRACRSGWRGAELLELAGAGLCPWRSRSPTSALAP